MKDAAEDDELINTIVKLLEVLEAGPCEESVLMLRAETGALKPYVNLMLNMQLVHSDEQGRLEITETGLLFLEEHESSNGTNNLVTI